MKFIQISFLYFYYFFAILGGSLKKTEKKITPRVPASKKTYTNVSIKLVLCFLCLNYTAPCFLVLLSPSFWNAPNSTCSVISAPIPLNTSLNRVLDPCHKCPKKNNRAKFA